LLLCIFYAIHLEYCQNSALPFIDVVFKNSDMHANLSWAADIREQGRLNPNPYHPYNVWMQRIAPYPQWVQWWGGEQTFQQSPLYAYLLALLLPNPVFIRLFQALMNMGICVFIGLLTARIAGRSAGLDCFLAGGSLRAVLRVFMAVLARWTGLVYHGRFIMGTGGINLFGMAIQTCANIRLAGGRIVGIGVFSKGNLSFADSCCIGRTCSLGEEATMWRRCPASRHCHQLGSCSIDYSKRLRQSSLTVQFKTVCGNFRSWKCWFFTSLFVHDSKGNRENSP